MITRHESIASLHEPGGLSLDAIQLSEGCMPHYSILGVINSREVFPAQGTIQRSSTSVLGQVEVLA